MKRPSGKGWASAAGAVLVLALGLVGVGLAGIARQDVEASVTVTFTRTALVVQHRHLQAGPARFVVANNGPKLHVLTISGPGLRSSVTQKVAAGKSATVTVKLRKGVYMLSGRIGAGPAKVRWLVVGPAASSSSSSREVQPFPDPVPQECD